MKEFKCRCSCIGNIMTDAKGKSYKQQYEEACQSLEDTEKKLEKLKTKNGVMGLQYQEKLEELHSTIIPELYKKKDVFIPSDTCRTYLEEVIKEQIYGRPKDFSNKYTDKGEVVEDDAIDIAIEHLGLIFDIKNEQQFENEYLTGTPDLVYPEEVIDIKSSWDCFTFPLFHNSFPTPKGSPNKAYEYQLQGYMALTEAKKARLVYVLCDTPDYLIEKEAIYTNKGQDPEEYLKECRARMTYSNIPLEYRVKSFEIARDDKVIEQIYERVELCREILEAYKLPITV